jgi:ABC-type oligopeptide transport system ATPase subunit
MEINILILIFTIVLFYLIITCCIDIYNNKYVENFVHDYYSWNWSHPYTITYINSIHPSYHNNHTYSLSCDFTDDAHPSCSNGLDIPSINKNGILQNNTI